MSSVGYLLKRNFILLDLRRFVCALFFKVSTVDFCVHDDDILTCGKEQVKILLINGNIIPVDVTGLDLLATTRAVLDALAGGAEEKE